MRVHERTTTTVDRYTPFSQTRREQAGYPQMAQTEDTHNQHLRDLCNLWIIRL